MRKRLLGLALVIIMILGCSMTTFAKTPEESGVKEVTTEVKEWGKVRYQGCGKGNWHFQGSGR